jgi:replicative DNA helicase
MNATTPASTEVAERAPLYDLGAERVILGILMTDSNAVDKALDAISDEDFYNPRHAEIYRAILQQYADLKPTEPISVAALLADRGDLARLGGGTYLSDCAAAVPTTAQLGFYMDRVAACAERRSWEAKGVQLVQAATSPGRDLEDLASLAESLILKAQPRRKTLEMTELGSLLNPAIDDIKTRRGRKVGIDTGFLDLDRMLGGLRRKELITIAGATGMGKSIAMVDIARHAAIKLRLNVAFFSFEMSKEEIFDRILAAEAGVPHHLIRTGNLEMEDWRRIHKHIGPMANAPLFLSDKAPMRVADVATACRQMQRGPGLDLVMVDHMHLMKPSDTRIIDLTQIIANVSPDLKRDLAMTLDVPVVAAAQLNRNPSGRPDKVPQLTDLKGSSAIEQDSNVVILIHRPDYYDKDSPRRGEADFVVAKNRNGVTDVVTVASQLHLSRFADMAMPEPGVTS